MSHESRVARLFVLAAFLPPLSLLCAQVVNLRVVEDSTRQPLPGVVLRDQEIQHPILRGMVKAFHPWRRGPGRFR